MIYGTRAPDTTMRRTRILALDLLVALGLALIAGAVALLLDAHPLGLEERTALNHALSLLFIGLAFVVGAWVADLALTQRASRLAPPHHPHHHRSHTRVRTKQHVHEERRRAHDPPPTLRARHPHKPRGST